MIILVSRLLCGVLVLCITLLLLIYPSLYLSVHRAILWPIQDIHMWRTHLASNRILVCRVNQ